MQLLFMLLISTLGVLTGCATMTDFTTGLTAQGQLTPCPAAPHCVSSQAADPEQFVEPLYLRDSDEQTWQSVIAVVTQQPRTELVDQQDAYVHAEVVSPWRFYTDDLELLRKLPGAVVDVRSSSRIGYYDFQVNRERVEALRHALADAGLLAGAR